MIQLDRLTKRYGEDAVVRELSLTIHTGELVVVLGSSGSGKTTTLKMINRLIEPTAGTVRLDGTDTSSIPPHELRRRIGYVFQEVGLFPHMTVGENIAITPSLLEWDDRHIAGGSMSFSSWWNSIPRCGTGVRMSCPEGSNNGWGVARALAAGPSVMLLDEPFGALDPLTRERLQESFRRIRKDIGLTAVFVTHDMVEALMLGDRIAVMNAGQLVQVGTPHELLSQPSNDYVNQLMSTPRRQATAVDALIEGERPQ